MRERLQGAELERLLSDNGCLDQPFAIQYAPGKYCALTSELKVYRANKYKLIGYAPGQEPPMQ